MRHVRLMFLLALLALVVWVAIARGGEPEEQTVFPERPPLGFIPEGATQYVGLADDGSRVAIRRKGSWVWMRVDVASTPECVQQIGADLARGLTIYEGDVVRGDEFEVAHQGDEELSGGWRRVLGAYGTGRFERGRVSGTYTRRDDLIVPDGGGYGCLRTVEFDIPQSTNIPPKPR